MSFASRTSRLNVFAFLGAAMILVLLTAGFGLASATEPVAVVSSGNLLSPAGYVDTAGARSLANGFPGLVDLRGWGVRLDSASGSLFSPASSILNVPLVSQNMSALGSNGAGDASINTHIHARDHDPSIARPTFPGGILTATPTAPSGDALITFVCCAYNPTVITITVGQSVDWSGNFTFPHPLVQVDGPSSDVPVPGGFANSTGNFYSFQFNTYGTFYYRCAIHGVAQFGGTMRGRIVVLPAGGGIPPVFLPLVIK